MWINVNGIKMYYEVHGSGRPLIMVHGNSENHEIFYESRVLLSKHFTVYTVDSRSHGHSTRVDELHYDDMADDMIAFMEQLDLRDVIFYGFSDGGIIGLLCAMRSDRIGKLIISGANLTPNGVKKPVALFVKAAYAVTKDPKMALMANEPDITPEDLAKIKVPTVVMAGEKDLVLANETAKIAMSIPGAKLRIIPGVGHGGYIVHKSQIADIIMEETGICEASAGAEYKAADKYKNIIADHPEVEAVMNDETHHGDAVLGMLKK